MEWDPEFEAVFTEVLQSKVGRFKLIAFVAGADRHMCFFLALAYQLGGGVAFHSWRCLRC